MLTANNGTGSHASELHEIGIVDGFDAVVGEDLGVIDHHHHRHDDDDEIHVSDPPPLDDSNDDSALLIAQGTSRRRANVVADGWMAHCGCFRL
jgi:hypothetical protein